MKCFSKNVDNTLIEKSNSFTSQLFYIRQDKVAAKPEIIKIIAKINRTVNVGCGQSSSLNDLQNHY